MNQENCGKWYFVYQSATKRSQREVVDLKFLLTAKTEAEAITESQGKWNTHLFQDKDVLFYSRDLCPRVVYEFPLPS
jgi:hypothetical protein